MGCVPIFLQPVEIHASNKDFTIGVDAYAIPTGTYPSILAVVAAINTLTTPDIRFCQLQYGAGGAFYVQFQFGSTATITWDDEQLALLLGWNDDSTLSTSTSHIAPNVPEKCWLPTYVESKRSSFALEQGKIIKGMNTGSGGYVGVQAHIDKYRRNFDFVHEPSTNVLRTHALTAAQEKRTFEYFILDVRRTRPVTATTVSTKGFYYLPDAETANSADTDYNQANMDSGGINFEYTTAPDEYVFCSVLRDNISRSNYSLPKSKVRMSVGFDVITAEAPNWS